MPTIQRCHVVLAVPDLDASQRWFEAVLGCTADEVDPGNWVFLQRDGVVFHLGRCPDAIPAAELGDHQYVAYLVVDDIDGFHEPARTGVQSAGGEIIKAPRDEPWGMREMALRTVDGHRIMLGQNLGRPSEAWPAGVTHTDD